MPLRCILSKTVKLHSGNLALVVCAASVVAPGAHAGTTVSINIKTAAAAPLAPGFSGYNAPQLRNGVEYYDPKFVAAVAPLNPGWLRFPAGTASLAYDWNPADATGGHININWMNSLITGDPAPVTGQAVSVLTMSQPLTQAKGGVYLSDFATFAHTFGAQTIVCFNGYTDTNPNSAELMAQAAESLGLNVEEWELANEAYLYPAIFSSAASYAAAMFNPYYSNIVSAAPDATTGVFLAGQFTGSIVNSLPPNWLANWDTGLSAYTPQYWNAISMHVYPLPERQTNKNTMQILNGVLAHGTGEYISSYVDPLIGANTPIFITELNCCSPDDDKFLSFLYNGIFLAEYIMRMSVVPNVKAVGINSLYTDNSDYHGLIQSFDDFESYLLAQVTADPAWSTDTATNPNTPYQFYTSAPGLAMEILNQAINNSAGTWPTTVTGGPYVAIQGYGGQSIPAVYAQGYQGSGGKQYIAITNKSASTCTTTIKMNGKPVTASMTVTTVTNSSAYVSNTAAAPNTVQIQTSTSGNPISIGPYSVTVVEW